MPFIRDWQFNFGSTTTATTITCALPSYQQNDLLLAILTTDTTAQTWTSTGWTQLFTSTNTSNLGVMWKIAGAAETAPTFTYTGAETANVHLLAIGDINTTTPFNGSGGAGTGYRTLANSAARVAMPILTTTVNNSLVLYINSESGAVVPGVLEGACTWEDAMDGSAHSDGFSWGFIATAGPTPSTVFSNKSGTAAGVLATIGISPPATGATVIPTYCAGDSSIYVDPIHGVTAYNGNTAFAATAVANFGSTLNGRTLSNGTAAVSADVGINSYHSLGQLTGVTTDGTYAGAALVLAVANKPNVTGKNILCHVKPSTPKVYQNLDNIAKATSKGVCFGLASAAGNYKFWHVHGFGTGWNTAQHVPIVINEAATPLHTTGTLNATSIASFGFAISGTLAAPVMQFGSLWVLDTTIVAGGTQALPVKVPGIVKAASTGKERMSVLQQGASQMLVLQPLQFGNGGTNPIYLDISNTATEFPQQYNVASKQVYYNSTDNVCGVTFYPGATDTIDLRNAVFSSNSKYHWRWHASTNTSATVLTDGVQVINAGDVQLRAITYSGMSFSNCTSIVTNGATITGATIKDSPISVSSLSNAALISNSTISKTTGTAHGITITGVAQNISLTGLTFTGFAASNGSTGNEAIYVNIASGNITINISGGNTPSIRTAGATVTVQNTKTFTISNIVYNSEVRIYKISDDTEYAGVENIGISTPSNSIVTGPDINGRYDLAYSHNLSNTPVKVIIINTSDLGSPASNYQAYYQEITLDSTDNQSLLVSQILDRNFNNP